MNHSEVTIIDYGVGNMLSVQRGLEKFDVKVSITSKSSEIIKSKRVILPGVGAFGNAMSALNDKGLIEVIKKLAEERIPLLGICLGMQMLMEESEEFGTSEGLGLIPGKVVAVPRETTCGKKHKIPHIGWNQLYPLDREEWSNEIHKYSTPGDFVYFVHSYMALPENKDHLIADCKYGGHSIAATIANDNVFGCQYHPEKSGECGLNILRSFLSLET